MAQVRWYLNNTTIDGWQLLDQSAATAATLPNGWVVGTGLTNSSEFASGAAGDRASSTFVGNTVPDGVLDTTLKDAWRSQFAWTGSFAAGNWSFQFAVVSTVQAGAADGQIVIRLLKANADGSNATQITVAQQAASICTNVGGTDVNGTLTFNPGAFTITNQYLFVQVAWKRTGAGGMTTTNIRLRTGSSSTVGTTGLTGDFTPAVTGAFIDAGSGAQSVADEHPLGMQTTATTFGNTLTEERGQSFIGNGGRLVGCKFNLELWTAGSILTLRAKVYATTGTHGTDAVPSGAAVATSADVTTTAAGLSTSVYTYVPFVFSGANQILLANGVTYIVSIESSAKGFDPSNVYLGIDLSTPTHAGNYVSKTSGGVWTFTTGQDLIFEVTTVPVNLFAPTVAYAPLAVTGETIASTAVVSSRQPIVAYAIKGATIDATSAAPPETLLVEHLSDGQVNSGMGTPGRQSSQTISGHTGILTAVSVEVSPGLNPTDGLYVEIRESTLNGTLLATSAIFPASKLLPDDPDSGVPQRVWAKLPLLTYVTMSAGTTYWIETYLTRTVTDSDNNWQLWGHYAGTYAGGEWKDELGNQVAEDWDLGFRLYITSSSHVVALASVADQTIVGATITGPAGDLLLEDGSGVLLEDGSALLLDAHAGVAQVFAPTVDQIAIDQAITTVPIASGAIVLVPSVAAGPVTVGGTTIAATSIVRVPSVAVGAVTITTAPRATTIQVFAPALTSVSLGATIPIGSGVFAPSVAATVTTATRASTSVLFAPTVASAVLVAHQSSTQQMFVLAVTVGPVSVTGATVATTVLLFEPAVGVGVTQVSGTTLPTTAQLFSPTLVVGPVTVLGATRTTTTQMYVPALAVGAVTITTAIRATTIQVFAPSLTSVSLGVTIPSGSGTFAPTVAQTVAASTRGTTSAVFAPSVGTAVTTATLAAGSGLNAPTVLPQPVAVTGTTLASSVQMFSPSLSVGPVAVTGATRSTTIQMFVASIAVGAVTVASATIATAAVLSAPALTQVAAGSIGAATLSTSVVVNAPTVVGGLATIEVPAIAATSLVRVPSIAIGAVTIGAVTVSSGTVVFQPSLAVGAITITGATLVPANQRFAPSVALTVTTATIGSTGQRFGVTVVPGAVAVVSGTVAPTLQLFAPTLAVGVTSLTGAMVGSTALVFPPATIARLDGTFIASTATTFPPTVQVTQFVTGAHTTSSAVLFSPSLLPVLSVTGATRLSTTQLFSVSVTTGAVVVGGSTVLASGTVHPPVVLAGAVVVTGAHRVSTVTIAAPMVTLVASGAHAPSTVQLSGPIVTTGAITVAPDTILSTGQVFVPSLGTGITTGMLASTSLPFAPTLIPYVTTPEWTPSTELFPPGVAPLGELYGPHQPSTAQVFPPYMVGHAPPAEILDFTSNLVREVMGTATVCRSEEGTVILTRDVSLVTAVDREVEMSASIVRREVEVGVER